MTIVDFLDAHFIGIAALALSLTVVICVSSMIKTTIVADATKKFGR